MFPRKKPVPKVILGTLLFNSDNALSLDFGLVPSVPKILGHIPKDMRAARCTNDSFMELMGAVFRRAMERGHRQGGRVLPRSPWSG